MFCVRGELSLAPFGEGNNRDKAFVTGFLFEFYHTRLKGIQCMVLAYADIFAGMVRRTALTHDNISC
ncbi:MAG: hypothetical protein ABR98_05320 [Cryomorphaceae bacterium BACL7 MAG-120910-bin2]|nr:MAG: hypothetical protein ABR98_05320 [Cryomorphaceae bacterium BACL7 MAG-120910-bin2]